MNHSTLPWTFVPGSTAEILSGSELVCNDFSRPPHEVDMQFMVAACNAHYGLLAERAALLAKIASLSGAAKKKEKLARSLCVPTEAFAYANKVVEESLCKAMKDSK